MDIRAIYREISKTAVLILACVISLLLLASCGGGGGGSKGGDDIDDDPAPPMPSRVQYATGGPGGDPTTTGIHMVHGEVGVLATFAMGGSYVPATKVYSLNQSPVPIAVMRVGQTGLDFNLPIADGANRFELRVDKSLEWRFLEHPVTGEFVVGAGNFIRIAVNPVAGGLNNPGVDLTLVEFGKTTADSSFSWDDFVALAGDATAEPYQRQAALAYLSLQRLFYPLHTVMQSFGIIAEYEDDLEVAGPGVPVSLPLCSPPPSGTFDFTWLDGPGHMANAVGPDDHFSIDLYRCWLNDLEISRGLYQRTGRLALNVYEEMSTPSYLQGFQEVVIENLSIHPTYDFNESTRDFNYIEDPTFYSSYSSVENRNGFVFLLLPDTSGIINLVNIMPIAGGTAAALILPTEVGNFAAELLAMALESTALNGTESCDLGGNFSYMLSANPFVNNATMSVTFNACVNGTAADSTTINGSYILTATDFISVNNLAFQVVLDEIAFEDDIGVSSIDGSLLFERVISGDTSNEIASSLPGNSLSISDGGLTATLSDFSISGSRTSTGLTLGATDERFRLDLSILDTPLDGTIKAPFSGPETTDLQAGSVEMKAQDNGTLLLSITDTDGTVQLDLDSDGDGTIDDSLLTRWDDLD